MKPDLPITALSERHIGLTGPIADYYCEGARVCLDRHHSSPTEFQITNADRTMEAVARWETTDERTRNAWANDTDTTEAGASACALAAVELSEGLVAVHRAETTEGADYYVAPVGTLPDDLEDCIRLEISGVDHGSPSVVAQRLKEKLAQALRGASNLPAMAGVVGFRERIILMAPVEDQ